MPDSIACESRITHVVVYARGALVTREVTLPVGVPAEPAVLTIPGVSALAEPGSLRAWADGERRITGLRAVLAWVQAAPGAAPDHEAQLKIQRELRRAQQRRDRLQHLRDMLEGAGLNTDLVPDSDDDDSAHVVDILARTNAALRVARDFDARIAAFDAGIEKLNEEEKRLNAEFRLLSPITPPQPGNLPTREVLVTLAPGSDQLRALRITYSVPAARWWPAYCARLSEGGTRAELALEAFVAQDTLEDWKGARVALCTADMRQEVNLPELPSLRLGRAQPPRRTGFREPPQGLDALFAGYDRDFPGTVVAAEPRPVTRPQPSPADYPRAEAPEMLLESRQEISAKSMPASAPMASYAAPPAPQKERMDNSRQRSKKSGAPPRGRASARDEEVAGDYDDESYAESSSIEGGGGGALGRAAMADMAPEEDSGGGPGSGVGPGSDAAQWLDFDGLELGQSNSTNRGRLGHRGGDHFDGLHQHVESIEYLAWPDGTADPRDTRGMFDHQFEAEGGVDIPSGGQAQRIRLLVRPAKARMRLVCVPLGDERVFREVELINPLDAPLLPGPVDVFMDGALVITSGIQAVDRGGAIRVGLGEEQRVRVARNVRVKEESKGLMGGKTIVDHTVTLEAASSLAGEVEVEVVDRLPVTDDKDIEVALTRSEPKPEKYDQSDRHSHVRGGLKWKLKLPAGGKQKAEYEYRITLASDHEIVGGNRRE
ncbi:MAG: mucoidy inhibitor MuiA family protein [Planctomycetes bacterium]|nr:mucoidy inhibitor MuiA family protein [Planctomycetota bacterium]